MKVLHVYAGNLFGGIETLLVTLARERHLCPDVNRQFALCFEGRLSQELLDSGVKAHQLGAVRLRYPWQVVEANARLREIIVREEIDVVICHACWSQIVFGETIKRMGVSLLFWCHDTPKGTSLLEKLAKFVRPNFIIANSKYTQKHLPLLYPNVPNQVIYHPIAPIQIENPALVRQQIRQQLGTAAETTVVIQVSRLERWKGQTVTIAALAQMKDLPNWECWIVGGVQRPSEQDYWEELKEQVKQLGLETRIRLLGQRQDVRNLLVSADIFCQPNLSEEPLGLVFIEALYAGLPVVTVAMGGGAEITTPECGYTVEPGNVSQIIEVLRKLVQNPSEREQFKISAVRRATQMCNPQQQMDTLNRATRNLLK